jgi:UDP-N-acetylglucosamine/UDP-N-acetylgalactosamine 4-epimerase
MKLTTEQTAKISASSFLVTGGAGFIGSHIAEFLLNAGARKVRVLDNLSTGHFRNIAPFANHPRFEFTNGDIRDIDGCKAACREMDYVFHLAALGSIPRSIKDPVTTNNVNTTGFLNMLLVAHDARIKRFVYASGSPINGTYNQASNPASPYAVSKYINELYAEVFTRLYGMETIGLRYFNVFGQRQDPHSEYAAVIPQFVMQLIRHQAPLINRRNEYSCDFTYVEDVVQANILAALTTDNKAINQVYNITFEEKITLHQLAEYLKEFLSAFDKSIANIEITPSDRAVYAQHSGAFAEKARELLGFEPHYSLRKGLLKTAGWYWAYLPQFDEEVKKTRKLEITN